MSYDYGNSKFIIIASISGFIFLSSCIVILIGCIKTKNIDDNDNNDLEENFVEDITNKKIEDIEESFDTFDNSLFTLNNNILTFHETETDL